MSEIDTKLDMHAQKNRIAPDAAGTYVEPLNNGVTVAFLAQAFQMDTRTVSSRLKGCPIKARKRRGTKMATVLYDFKTACSYLVTPAMSSKEYLRSVKRGDLPAALQQQVWDALLKRQRWEENAGELWRTDRVRAVLSGTFQKIKFTMQLWTETLERQTEVTSAQRDIIIKLVDELQKEVYEAMVTQAAESQTGPQTDEMLELVGETGTVEDIIKDMNSPDTDDWEDLV